MNIKIKKDCTWDANNHTMVNMSGDVFNKLTDYIESLEKENKISVSALSRACNIYKELKEKYDNLERDYNELKSAYNEVVINLVDTYRELISEFDGLNPKKIGIENLDLKYQVKAINDIIGNLLKFKCAYSSLVKNYQDLKNYEYYGRLYGDYKYFNRI